MAADFVAESSPVTAHQKGPFKVHTPSRAPLLLPLLLAQSPSPPRSLVCDGQPSPHRPRLVVSRSTCPPLSPSPHAWHANSFIQRCSNKHTPERLGSEPDASGPSRRSRRSHGRQGGGCGGWWALRTRLPVCARASAVIHRESH